MPVNGVTYFCAMLNSSKSEKGGPAPRTGILGGGQLGRMLLQAAANYPVETFLMENDEQCPAAHLCHHFTSISKLKLQR
jgi:hypothetical protein